MGAIIFTRSAEPFKPFKAQSLFITSHLPCLLRFMLFITQRAGRRGRAVWFPRVSLGRGLTFGRAREDTKAEGDSLDRRESVRFNRFALGVCDNIACAKARGKSGPANL